MGTSSGSAVTAAKSTSGAPPRAAVAEVGLVGLAVMGQNMALNIADHGFTIAVYNRTTSVMEEMVAKHPPGSFGQGYGGRGPGGLVGCTDVKDFIAAIKRPRKIILLVKAGAATDAVVTSLEPLLEPGDIVIDGGNAHWDDTTRREAAASAKGYRFIGSGVSGGEVGARFGPSLMPGGDPEAWKELEPIWTAIAAKVDPKTGKPLVGAEPGKPIEVPGAESCTAYMGPGAAGHYVKMVHNGIEYGDMQLICEAYHLLRDVVTLSPERMAAVFADWNTGDLDSFLIEITADILGQKDPATGKPFVDVVLDAAGQKGTGKWTSTAALDLGMPASTIAEAVFARCMSALKAERVRASELLRGPGQSFQGDPAQFTQAVRQALYCSKICSYAQGFQLLAAASAEFKWNLDFGRIAMIWRGGCIIRARFLQKIKEAYDRDRGLRNLLLDPYFAGVIQQAQTEWRRVLATAATLGVPTPAFSSALAYYDSYRCARLPANLLQAQRDYFGAHTYERTDAPRGAFFHLDWPDPKRPQLAV
jgi:6-phosphogluconate dehydrogenase